MILIDGVQFLSRLIEVQTEEIMKVKVKADIALHGNPISELRDVTCRLSVMMGVK